MSVMKGITSLNTYRGPASARGRAHGDHQEPPPLPIFAETDHQSNNHTHERYNCHLSMEQGLRVLGGSGSFWKEMALKQRLTGD